MNCPWIHLPAVAPNAWLSAPLPALGDSYYRTMPDGLTNDGAMHVFDFVNGAVEELHHAYFLGASPAQYSANGAAYYELASDGLSSHYNAGNASNSGHRGVPPSMDGIRRDEIRYGAIEHVLEMFMNQTKNRHCFPMDGDESLTNDQYAAPEGTHIRLKAGVIARLQAEPKVKMTRAVQIVLQALADYGALIGDAGPNPPTLKLENVVTEQGACASLHTNCPTNDWTQSNDPDALGETGLYDISVEATGTANALSFQDDFEVVELGWNPTNLAITTPCSVDPNPMP